MKINVVLSFKNYFFYYSAMPSFVQNMCMDISTINTFGGKTNEITS